MRTITRITMMALASVAALTAKVIAVVPPSTSLDQTLSAPASVAFLALGLLIGVIGTLIIKRL